MTAYDKGYRFEREVVNDYKRRGWPVAFRSAGSHSHFDIVASWAKEGHWIQCKRDGQIGKAEREQLRALLDEVSGRIFIASKDGKGIKFEEV